MDMTTGFTSASSPSSLAATGAAKAAATADTITDDASVWVAVVVNEDTDNKLL